MMNLLKSKPVRYVGNLLTVLSAFHFAGCGDNKLELVERYEPVILPNFYKGMDALAWDIDKDMNVDVVTDMEHELITHSSSYEGFYKSMKHFKINGGAFPMSSETVRRVNSAYNVGKGFYTLNKKASNSVLVDSERNSNK